MSQIFPSTGPISVSDIITFINSNTTQNISQSNASLRNLFEIMRSEYFTAQNGDFFAPDSFSEMRGMYGRPNEVPTITLNGESNITILAGEY